METGAFFREKNYHAHSGTMEIVRQWLWFSSTMKKPYCQRCWFFCDPLAKQKIVGQRFVEQPEKRRSEDQIT